MKLADKPIAKEMLKLALEQSKQETIAGIYNRLKGGADGRIRTKLAPYTETGRLRSGEDDWWPEPTTNLQNLPKKVAALDPLYEVRNCIVPQAGHVFIEGDLKQAESIATTTFAKEAAQAIREGNQAEAMRVMAEARASGFELDQRTVRYWTKELGRTAADRRLRRTPQALRQEYAELFEATGTLELGL